MTKLVDCRACLGYGYDTVWIGTKRYGVACHYCNGRGQVRMKDSQRVRGFEVLPVGEGIVELPQRSTTNSAGYDLQATHDTIIPAGKHFLLGTGVTVYLPPNEELQIRPRSGLALKHGITVLNSPGTIDSDFFPNEIGVILINHSDEDFFIKKGDRICQAVFAKVLFTDDDQPKEQKRSSGFGHTGI